MSQSRHGLKGHRMSSIHQGKTETKIKNLENKLKDLERSLDNIEQDIADINSNKSVEKKEYQLAIEKVWKCSKCGLRLGIYDAEEDLLRVRYKDFYAYFRAGIGGYTKVVCRSCSHINQLNYMAKEK